MLFGPYHVIMDLCFTILKNSFQKVKLVPLCEASQMLTLKILQYPVFFLISDVEFELGEEFGPIHPKIPERPEVEDIVLTTGWPPSRDGVTMFCFFIHHGEK